MKKVALISLILIYSMASFGVTFKGFYCCGKLKTFMVSLADLSKDKAAKDNEKDGCCKTKFQSFKIKDTHVAAENATTPLNLYTAVLTNISLLPSKHLVAQEIDV